MSPAPPRLTRRRLLAGVGGLGAFGVSGGAGTDAVFHDAEGFTGFAGAGTVEVGVECDGCSVEDGRVQFALGDIEPGTDGVERFTLDVIDNPIRVWLTTDCPPVGNPLSESLLVRFAAGRACETHGADRQLFPDDRDWGTLAAFQRALAGGIRLDDPTAPCLSPESVPCFVLRYRLPADATWLAGAEADLGFDLFAEQCRHVSEANVASRSPAASPCPEQTCPDCLPLGTLDVVGDRLAVDRRYALTDIAPEFDDDHRYELEVLAVTDKRDGRDRETVCASVRLLRDGSEHDAPPVCSLAVGGGPPTPGMHPSDPESRSVRYEVVPPITRTRGQLCAATDRADPESEPDAERPAISNIVVSVCGETDEDAETDDCVPCTDGANHRAHSATLSYEGPDGVTLTVSRARRGRSKEGDESLAVEHVDDGATVTVEFPATGVPEFTVSVQADGTESVLGTLHTSCSQPFGPGVGVADGPYAVTVVAARDGTGTRLCEVTDR